MNKLAVKWTVIIIALIGSVFLLYPTYEWYSKTPAEREALEASGDRPKRILNLGLDLRGGSSLLLELDVSKLSGKESLNDSMQRAIEIVRNRIDQYGVGEIPITKQGEKWISVQLPGIANPEQAEALIGKTALLEFRLVDESPKAKEAIEKLNDLENPFNADGSLTEEAQALMPEGITVMKGKDSYMEAVTATAAVTGADLEDARISTGEYGYPAVSFTFNSSGAKKVWRTYRT